jgi:tetratricopeptide (TPR) repeat protein
MARLLLALLLLLPLATPVRAADSALETQLHYLEKDLDRLREEVKALPEARRLERLEAETVGLRAEIKAAEKSAEEAVKEKLEAQDKRIGDLSLVLAGGANKIAASSNAISSASNAASWIVGIGSILLTAGLFGVGLYSVIKVPEQSRLAAEQIIKDYLRSTDAKRDFHNSVEIMFGSDIAAIQSLLKRGDRLLSNPSNEPAPPPSAETEQALLKVLAVPEEKRTTDQWRALIISRVEQKSYESALALVDRWLSLPDQTQEDTARALLLKGWALHEARRLTESLVPWEELNQRFGTDPAPVLREQVAMALVNKGVVLAILTPERQAAVVTAYDDAIRFCGNDPSPALRNVLAAALNNRGFALTKLVPPQQGAAIADYDQVILRFGDDPTQALQEVVAKALVNKGDALSMLIPKQQKEAIDAYDEVIRRCGDDPAPALSEIVAKALVNKSVALATIIPKQQKEAIATCDEVIRRFGDNPTPVLREGVARALQFKGVTLQELADPIKARATYEDYLHRFAKSSELEIQEITAQVRAALANLPAPEPAADP